MTKDEMLAKARRDYPIGTKYKSAYSQKLYTVTSCDFMICNNYIRAVGFMNPIIHIIKSNKWAEIISKPKQFNYYFY